MTQALPSGVRIDNGRGGLPRLTIDSALCTAELYLHGAHLCRWQPRSQAHPVLWMSERSRVESGAPIRGGVPICFPWFGPRAGEPSAPIHGIARISPWSLEHAATEPDGTVTLSLALACGPARSPHLQSDLALAFDLRLGSSLTMALTVTNVGTGPATFEEALHTYVAVGDVRQAAVAGLQGAIYVDKVDGAKRKQQSDEMIKIAAETDRLYLDTESTVTLTDPRFSRRITVAKAGSRSTVVWNPWVAKSQAMPDFGDDEWPGMICIETANAAANAITLPPSEAHTMTAAISVEPA